MNIKTISKILKVAGIIVTVGASIVEDRIMKDTIKDLVEKEVANHLTK